MPEEPREDEQREKGEAKKPEEPEAPAPHHAPPKAGIKNWGTPLVRVDRIWTSIEARLCLGVLVAEILSLFLWISLKGLKAQPGDAKGIIFRAMVMAALFCLAAHVGIRLATKKKPLSGVAHGAAVSGAAVVGLLVGKLLAGKGVGYYENLFNWLQLGSSLYLVRGIKGMVTRLTIWLALLGASLATAKGKHINIDVLLRFMPVKARVPAAVTSWIAAAAVCFAGAVGFCDYLAVTQYNALPQPCAEDPHGCERPVGEKISLVKKEVGNDLFLLGRQMSLDWKSFPKVVAGKKWDGWLSAGEWNDWLKGADWEGHFGKQKADGYVRQDSGFTLEPRVPATEGLLIRDLSFVFPFGLLMIGLRFLLRVALVLSGHVNADPEAAHTGEEDLKASDEAGEAA